MSDDPKKVPEGRFSRLARLASLGVKAGADAIIDRTGERAAKQALEVLGTMRGLAAKAGQMASYVDGVVPEGQREAFENGLRALRAAAPRSHPGEVRRLVEEELGGPIDRLYAEWQDEPLASASIGQVHRARLYDGTEVAVKVHHPGVARALRSDLENAGTLELFQRNLIGRKFESGRMLDEVKQHLLDELDYRLEAERQRRFRAIHAGDDRVRVPRVIDERSASRVLTSELVSGIDFDAACRAPAPERLKWAETLWRWTFRAELGHGLFNADPHPGNYLFGEDGQISFLDFGCVVTLIPEHLRMIRLLHGSAVARDRDLFRSTGAEFFGTRGSRMEPVIVDYLEYAFSPLFRSPWRMTRPFAADLVARMGEAMKTGFRTPADEFIRMPPGMMMMNRMQFGFYSVLARLDVEMDYAEIERFICANEGVELIPGRSDLRPAR